MFAESLLESSSHVEHHAGWAKLTSLLLQCMAVAMLLAVPLLNVERLQVIPRPPSIRLTSVQQPVVAQAEPAHVSSPTPPEQYVMVQPSSIPSQIAHVND